MEEMAEVSSSGCESPLSHNPFAPPGMQYDEQALADIIKGTVISKNWVYSILLKLLKGIEEPSQSSKTEEGEGEGSEAAVDVDEDEQDELCHLWDISGQPEVAMFLQEFKAVSILAKVITDTKMPRMREICIGILGNMCCVSEICKEMAENETVMSLMLALLSNTEFDPQTLTETMRFLITSLSNQEVSYIWIDKIKETPSIRELVLFIFQSSTNVELLKCTGEMVDTLLDVSDELCHDWASSDLVLATLEAVDQIGYSTGEEVGPFLHLFQQLSTQQSGVQALVENGENLLKPLLGYLDHVCDYEIVGIDQHMSRLASVISLLHVLFTSDPAIARRLSSKATLFEYMLKVLEAFYCTGYEDEYITGLPACILTSRQDSIDSQTTEIRRYSSEQQHIQDSSTKASKQADTSTMTLDKRKDSNSFTERQGSSDTSVKASEEENSGINKERDRNEKSPERRGSVEDEKRAQIRLLFELLQGFFRVFIDSLQLETGDKEAAVGKNRKAKDPPFLPVLHHLDTRSRECFSYLVHTLAQNIPDTSANSGAGENTPTTATNTAAVENIPDTSSDRAAAERGGDADRDSVSEKGWRCAQHLCQLCEKLNFSRSVRYLTRVMKKVKSV